MFTGIITATGRVETVDTVPEGVRLRIAASWPEPDFVLGESIALDGACMTVVSFEGCGFEVEVSSESLARTTLGDFQPGRLINLERALAIGDRLGGHFVSGHVDGKGLIESIAPAGDCLHYLVSVPTELLRYVVSKGSLCVDGISLTVNSLDDDKAEVALMIVPHTQQATSLRDKGPGDAVNLEVDLLGKYVERLLDRS